MSDAYLVSYREASELLNEWSLCQKHMSEAFEVVSKCVQDLTALESFGGAGAEAAKAYFTEVHVVLLEAIKQLALSLSDEYAVSYYQRFSEPPVSEGQFAACWPSQDMSNAEVAVWKTIGPDGPLNQTDRLLKAAMREASEAGECFSMPSPQNLREHGVFQATETQKVRDGVAAVESHGYSAFSRKKGEFNQLAVALEKAISSCAKGKVPIVAYAPGTFETIAGKTGLSRAYQAAVSRHALIGNESKEARKKCLLQAMEYYEQQIDIGIEDKKNWLTVGLIATLIGIVGSVVTIASGGTGIALVMAIYDLATGVGSSLDKVAMIKELEDGSLEKVTIVDQDGKRVVKLGKTTLGDYDTFMKYVNSYKDGDEKILASKLDSIVGGKFESMLKKEYGESTAAEYKKIKTLFKEGGGAVKDLYSGKFSGQGTADVISKCVSAYSDSEVAKIDEELREYQDDINKYTELGEEFGYSAKDFKYSTVPYEGATCEYVPPAEKEKEEVVGRYDIGSGRFVPA